MQLAWAGVGALLKVWHVEVGWRALGADTPAAGPAVVAPSKDTKLCLAHLAGLCIGHPVLGLGDSHILEAWPIGQQRVARRLVVIVVVVAMQALDDANCTIAERCL